MTEFDAIEYRTDIYKQALDNYNLYHNPNYGKEDEESDPYGIGDKTIKQSESYLARQEAEDEQINKKALEDAENFIQEVPDDYMEGQEYHYGYYQPPEHTFGELQHEIRYQRYLHPNPQYSDLRMQLKHERKVKEQPLERDVYVPTPPKFSGQIKLERKAKKEEKTFEPRFIDSGMITDNPTYRNYESQTYQPSYTEYNTQTETIQNQDFNEQTQIYPSLSQSKTSYIRQPGYHYSKKTTETQTTQPREFGRSAYYNQSYTPAAQTERYPRINYKYTKKRWIKTKSGKWKKQE